MPYYVKTLTCVSPDVMEKCRESLLDYPLDDITLSVLASYNEAMIEVGLETGDKVCEQLYIQEGTLGVYKIDLVKNEKENLTYLKFKESEIRKVDHYCVWQTSDGISGDSYWGYLLFPLSNGKYFKVSYSC